TGTCEVDDRVRLGFDTLVDHTLHLSGRRMATVVAERFLPSGRRERRDVLLHERLELQRVDVAHEDEGESARVRESLLVEGERLLRIHFSERRRRERS